jgi:IS30 family transposase
MTGPKVFTITEYTKYRMRRLHEEGFSYGEISRALGVSDYTIKKELARRRPLEHEPEKAENIELGDKRENRSRDCVQGLFGLSGAHTSKQY